MNNKDYYEYHESKESLLNDHCCLCGTEDDSWHECGKCGEKIDKEICSENKGMCDKCLGKE